MKPFRRRLCIWPAAVVVAATLVTCPAIAQAEGPDFERDIAPLLESKCLSCHNAGEAKGDLVLETRALALEHEEAIVPGDAGASLLMAMVSGADPDMPKKGEPLSAREIGLLRSWIASGAHWPEKRVLKDSHFADHNWWSLKPLVRPEIPPFSKGADAAWCKTPVDAFVRARQIERGLSPSEEAPARDLCRRLYFDLTGLPPKPEDIRAFEASHAEDADGAVRELADQLMASPQYGERWARHWLDLVRYGESHGYDKDKPRDNAWPYRDYVIASFNEDKPYARFVQEQIAGDVLWPGEPEGVVALGFIAAGPWDFIAHYEVGEGKVDGRIAKHMDRDDMVSATFNTFMSITVQCAQCHDHKFDPVTMEDYYSLHTIFAALDRADRYFDTDPAIEKRRGALQRQLTQIEADRKSLEEEIARRGGDALVDLDREIERLAEPATAVEKSPEYGYHSQIESKPESEKWVQIDLGSAQVISEVILAGAHDEYNGIGSGFGFPARFRVEVSDDSTFGGDVLAIADYSEADFGNPGIAPVRLPAKEAVGRYVRITAVKLAERKNDYILALAEVRVTDPAGVNLAEGRKVSSLDSIEARPRWAKQNLVDGRSPRPVDEASLGALLAAQESRERLMQDILTPDLLKQRTFLTERSAKAKKELAELPKGRLVYAAATEFQPFGKVQPTGGKPREIHLLKRGDIRSPGDVMSPGAPALWEGAGSGFAELPDKATEGERRAALARYLTDRDNPLTWRSIVNRVWLYHFGRGIVDSPNDLGRMGMEPTHPELLDWLAAEFRDGGQSFKALHRMIVTSAAYRQTSMPEPGDALTANREADGSNAYYWRMNRRKLSAEEVRDSILAVSGKLDLTVGGPSFQDFVIEKPQHSPHYQYELWDPNDPAGHRRAVYRYVVRSRTHPFMTVLDCADPSQMVAKRDETTTALQALSLMNNPFVEAMAQHFATRVAGEADTAGAAFELALGRAPDGDERLALEAYASEHGLANACRLILNLNEFSYVD